MKGDEMLSNFFHNFEHKKETEPVISITAIDRLWRLRLCSMNATLVRSTVVVFTSRRWCQFKTTNNAMLRWTVVQSRHVLSEVVILDGLDVLISRVHQAHILSWSKESTTSYAAFQMGSFTSSFSVNCTRHILHKAGYSSNWQHGISEKEIYKQISLLKMIYMHIIHHLHVFWTVFWFSKTTSACQITAHFSHFNVRIWRHSASHQLPHKYSKRPLHRQRPRYYLL